MNKNKRRTLKISAFTGATLSSPSWVKPAVKAIVLPAHAQTSVLPGRLTLIDSFLIDTSANDFFNSICYQVDDRPVSGSSEPIIVTVPEQNNDTTICVELFGFFVSGVITETDNFVVFKVGSTTQSHSVSHVDNTAQDPNSTPSTSFSGVPAMVTIGFSSISGAPWELTYSVSQVGSESFMVSDVVVSSI